MFAHFIYFGICPESIPPIHMNAMFDIMFADIVPKFCDTLDGIEAKLRAQGHGYTAPEDDLPTWDELITGRTIV